MKLQIHEKRKNAIRMMQVHTQYLCMYVSVFNLLTLQGNYNTTESFEGLKVINNYYNQHTYVPHS